MLWSCCKNIVHAAYWFNKISGLLFERKSKAMTLGSFYNLHKSILYDEIKLGTSNLRQWTKHP